MRFWEGMIVRCGRPRFASHGHDVVPLPRRSSFRSVVGRRTPRSRYGWVVGIKVSAAAIGIVHRPSPDLTSYHLRHYLLRMKMHHQHDIRRVTPALSLVDKLLSTSLGLTAVRMLRISEVDVPLPGSSLTPSFRYRADIRPQRDGLSVHECLGKQEELERKPHPQEFVQTPYVSLFSFSIWRSPVPSADTPRAH